jgi:phosphonate transport system substrate-binding protein
MSLRSHRRPRALACALIAAAIGAVGATGATAQPLETTQPRTTPTLAVSAIPDQDPQVLQRLYGLVADYLSRRLDVRVVYKPMTDYTAAVTGFKVGDLQLVWFGGLTGVQARLQVPGAQTLAQRDIDARFHSVFIANRKSGLKPVRSVSGLSELKGHSFTFGSNSSTSGYLMPQYFLRKAHLSDGSFRGVPGLSGSHDATIALVTAGSYEAGVLNEQVWKTRLAAGEIDTAKVQVIYRTPAYHDYHWLARPDLDRTFGKGFTRRLRAVLLDIRGTTAAQRRFLTLFGAKRFVPTRPSNYRQLEQIARTLDLVR